MNYEEKYKQALERAKKGECLESIFPELKEDEKISREITEFLVGFNNGGYESPNENTIDSWLTWLEKQGQKKPTDNVAQKIHIEKGKWYVCIKTFNLNCNTVVEKGRTYKSQENNTISGENNRLFIDKHDGNASKYFRPWTIRDAKSGDIIYHRSSLTGVEYIVMFRGINGYGSVDSYFRYNSEDGFGINIPSVFSAKSDITPATEEQRGLLFSKMKEAGYEWDADTKELKKIEQKPTWNEEDNDAIDIAIRIIQNGGDDCAGILDSDKALKWLKSLKDRIQQPK